MGLEIPDEVKWLLPIVVGESWPEGDEDKLRELRDAWTEAAQALPDAMDAGNAAARDVLASWQGEAAQRFDETWKKFTAGESPVFTSLGDSCNGLAEACDKTALDIEYTKYMIIASLIMLAIQVAAVVRDVDQRRTRYFDYDIELIERTGTGTDTLSVLGRALTAASRREYKPEMALRIAVNHSGSSALTGALTGAIIGARAGVAGLPRQWVEALDVRDLLLELAEDAFWHFAHRNVLAVEGDDDWTERYPRW